MFREQHRRGSRDVFQPEHIAVMFHLEYSCRQWGTHRVVRSREKIEAVSYGANHRVKLLFFLSCLLR